MPLHPGGQPCCLTQGAVKVKDIFLSEKKLLDIHNPEDYLYLVMERATMCTTDDDWDNLLPWNIPMDEVKPLRDFLLGAKPDPQRTKPYLLRGKSI